MAIALASYEGIISCLGMILGFIYPLSFRFHKYGFTGLYTDSRIAYLSAESKRIQIAAIENGYNDRDTKDSIKQRLVTVLFKFRLQQYDGQQTNYFLS